MTLWGYIFMVIGFFGALFFFTEFLRSKINKPENDVEQKNLSEDITKIVPTVEKLKTSQAKQIIKLTGEFVDRSIVASIDFYELTQMYKGAPWTRTGVISKALCLSGGIWIFKIPSRDAGKATWLKASEIDTPSLMPFYKGGDKPGEKGPARLFKENGQVEPISYQLPRNLTPGVIWEIADIGAFNPEVSGDTENVVAGDRLYFVTSKEQKGERWLLFLDARRGEAKGTGGLFLAEQFEPSVDIMEII